MLPGSSVSTTEIGSYRLEQELGRGPHGIVHRAVAEGGEAVAIKVVHPMLATDAGFVEALRREYAKMSAVACAGLVRVRDLWIEPDSVAIVSDLPEGQPLSALSGPRPVEEVVAVLRAALEALGECHARGLVHANLKPSNVWVDEGRARFTDAGLARAGDQVPGVRQLGGDLDFTAPEAFQGRREAPGDVYALGQIVWMLLVGRPACPAGSEPMKMAWHLTSGAPDVLEERPDVPVWLGELVASMVAVDEVQRPRDALKAADLLDTLAARPVVLNEARTFEPLDDEHRPDPADGEGRKAWSRPTWQPERNTWSDGAPDRGSERPTGTTPTMEADRAPPAAAASPWLVWGLLGAVAVVLVVVAAVAWM